jgi:hypothetical protein
LSITPAPLTGAVLDVTREYGDSTPAFSVDLQGRKFTEDEVEVDAGFQVFDRRQDDAEVTDRLPFISVGENRYLINAVTSEPVTLVGADAGNYVFDGEIDSGNLSVSSVQLEIRANDFARFFGQQNPPFDASFSGFKLDDDANVVQGLNFRTRATEFSPVGLYRIDPFGAIAENYRVSFLPGTLTVESRVPEEIQQVQPDATTDSKLAVGAVQPNPIVAPPMVFAVPPAPIRAEDLDLLYSNDGNRQLWGQ